MYLMRKNNQLNISLCHHDVMTYNTEHEMASLAQKKVA